MLERNWGLEKGKGRKNEGFFGGVDFFDGGECSGGDRGVAVPSDYCLGFFLENNACPVSCSAFHLAFGEIHYFCLGKGF